jgi:uncharacterized protein
MKKSRYNFFYPLEDGKYLAFNALKNGLAVVEKDVVDSIDSLENGTRPQLDDQLLAELERGGFVCADDFDEYGLLTIRRHKQQYATNVLGLTIAPTLDCNLACTYCYETPQKVSMTPNVVDGVVNFVKGYADTMIKVLEVCWYGGEPLLCLDTVEKLSSEFIALCSEKKITYSSYIVTNGTYFTPETARKLKELKVRGAQITIDGDRDTHNMRRPYRGGGGTFDAIFENVKNAVGIIPIDIRVNVDTYNVDKAMAFFKQLETHDWFRDNFGDKVVVHFGHVRYDTNSCKCKGEENLRQSEFWKKELELQTHIYKKGYPFTFYPDISAGCGASALNSYVMDPEGRLYKCWNDLGIPEKAVGTIFKPVIFSSRYITNMVESFETDPDCRQCKYLPICMGGCMDTRVKAKRGEYAAKNCSGWKYYLDKTLKMYYLSRLKQKENQPVQGK